MRKKLTHEEKVDLADQASELEKSPIFGRVMAELKEQYLAELLAKEVGDLTIPSSHAKLRALEDIRQSLNALKTDAKISAKSNS